MDRYKLKTQSLSVFTGQFLGFILNFIIPIILTRIISKAEFGIFQQYNLFFTTLSTIIGTWFWPSILYFFPKEGNEKKQSIILAILIIQLITWSLFYLASKIIPYTAFQDNNFIFMDKYADILLLSVLFFVFSSITDYIFIVQNDIKYNIIFPVIDKFIKLSFLLILGYLYNIEGIFFSILFYSFFRMVLIACYIKKYIKVDKIIHTVKYISDILVYSIPFGVGITIQTIAQRLDKFILIKYIDSEKFAVYSVAFYSIPVLGQAIMSINNVALPKLTEYLLDNKKEEVLKLWKNMILKNATLTIPTVTFFFILAPEIIEIFFTSSYLESIYFYRIYIIIFIFMISSYGVVLRALGKTKFVLKANLNSFLICLPLAILFIPVYKEKAAIFISVIAWTLPIIFQVRYELKLLSSKISDIIPLKKLLTIFICSIMSSFFIIITKIIITNNLMILLISFSLYFFTTSYFLNIFKLFPFQEIIIYIKGKFS